MRTMLRSVCTVSLFATLVSAHASAQTQIEVAAGYNVVDYDEPNATPVGWFASIVAEPSPWFAVVSELTAEFNSDDRTSRPVKQRGFTFLDGPRFIGNTRWGAVFAEVLVGIAHDRDFLTARSDANHFVWQPGAGVDLKMSTRVSARFQIGVRADSDISSPIAVRFLSGLVVTNKSWDELKPKPQSPSTRPP